MSGRMVVVAVVVGVAVLAGAGGCGVQLDEEPRPLAADSVPFGLLEPSTTTTPGSSGTASPSPAEQSVSVFLVDNDGYLVEVQRAVPAGEPIEAALMSLLSPLTEAERDAGLTTAIASTTGLRNVIGPEDGLVTIDLSSAIDASSPDVIRVALAQIVYTATAVVGVDRVLFQVDGQAREVPTGQGQSTAEPLHRVDYRQLLRPPTSTTVVDDPSGGG